MYSFLVRWSKHRDNLSSKLIRNWTTDVDCLMLIRFLLVLKTKFFTPLGLDWNSLNFCAGHHFYYQTTWWPRFSLHLNRSLLKLYLGNYSNQVSYNWTLLLFTGHLSESLMMSWWPIFWTHITQIQNHLGFYMAGCLTHET